MAPHSSILAWKVHWMEEPGGLQSMGSLRVGHDWVTSLSFFAFMHRRRQWHPTPVFLPGESQGRGSLVGCHLWGCIELDTTEATEQQQQRLRDFPYITSYWECLFWTDVMFLFWYLLRWSNIFLIQSVNVMNCNDTEWDLPSSDKPFFIVMYYYSYTLLDKIC